MSNQHVLQPSARSTLVSLVEEHMTSLVRESVCVKRHSKRARLNLPSGPALLDGNNVNGYVKQRLHADDVNLALQWRGSEKLYVTGSSAITSGGKRKVDLEEYLKREIEINSPKEVGLSVHWLAVDGKQPDIPQNPQESKKEQLARDDMEETKPGVLVNQLRPRLLNEELQLYYTRITTALQRGGSTPTSRRQQDAAIKSISEDAWLQELVPFFVNYASQSLYKHIGDTEHCRSLVRMVHALLANPHLHLELHLHQLLPALITSVVAKQLSTSATDNHWSLRAEAAQTLAQACTQYGEDYATLKARVLRTLVEATAADKPLASQFGGFVGISNFGRKAVNAFLAPLFIEYWDRWQDALACNSDLEKQTELQMCSLALLNSLQVFLNIDYPRDLTWVELEDTFADRIVPMMATEPSEYTFCVV